MKMTALTIAERYFSEGAGIQAEDKRPIAHCVNAMCAKVYLSAQNMTGEQKNMEAEPEFLEDELECTFTDIWWNAEKQGCCPLMSRAA